MRNEHGTDEVEDAAQASRAERDGSRKAGGKAACGERAAVSSVGAGSPIYAPRDTLDSNSEEARN